MKNKNLHNINKTGFKAPKNYFESFEDTLMDKINSDELKDFKTTGFKIPENYFESVENNVFKQLNEDNKTKIVTLFSRRNFLYLSGVAAAVLIMFNVFFNKNIENLNNLDSEVVETYLLNQDISSYELIAMLTEEELSNINFEILDEAFNNESIEDYLLENVDLEDIIEQ